VAEWTARTMLGGYAAVFRRALLFCGRFVISVILLRFREGGLYRPTRMKRLRPSLAGAPTPKPAGARPAYGTKARGTPGA